MKRRRSLPHLGQVRGELGPAVRVEVVDRAPAASERLQADIYRDVRRVYERYFPLQAAKDVAFELGRVCMGLRRYLEAVQLFAASQRQCGEHHITCYNMGICLFHMAEMRGALACFDRSLHLKPDYIDAASWRSRALERLGAAEAAAAAVASAAAAEVAAETAPLPAAPDDPAALAASLEPPPSPVDARRHV